MNGWREVRLGDEIELAYGKSLPAHSRKPGGFGVFGSNGLIGMHDEACVKGPGIVVGRKGSVGEINYSHDAFWPIDTTYYVVNKGDHSWRFLYYLLRHIDLTGLNSHSAVPGLNREDVYSIAVNIPSRREQDEIAKALDSIEDRIRLEMNSLSTAQELKHAVVHGLFAKGLRGEAQKDSEIGLVPKSWSVVSFGEVREWLQYGTSARCTVEQRKYPVLRIPNVESGRINPSDLKYCDLAADDGEKYALRSGDILFIRTNGVLERLGSCAVYQGEPEGALFASYLIRARIKTGINPKCLAYFYGSRLGTSLVAGRATPAADGKYNLNTGAIDSLLLPLPSTLDEQAEIVGIIEAVDCKITLHQKKHAALERIFQSLLHKLMAGEISVSELNLSARSLGLAQQERDAA